jgi:hypothetical protein
MKITPIFDERLYVFQHPGEIEHEFKRLLSIWNNPAEILEFVNANRGDTPRYISTNKLVEDIISNAIEIEDTLIKLGSYKNERLSDFFKSLNNQATKIVELSFQKGRIQYLRIYALRIDENCFAITGGAIKFTKLMEERPHTAKELIKIKRCKNYLKANNVLDADSFYEFLNE